MFQSAGYVADSTTVDEDIFIAPADAKLNVACSFVLVTDDSILMSINFASQVALICLACKVRSQQERHDD